MSAEGGVFDLMAGRYSATGMPNFEVFLKGHAGDTIIVDRVGRPAERIDHPAVTIKLLANLDRELAARLRRANRTIQEFAS